MLKFFISLLILSLFLVVPQNSKAVNKVKGYHKKDGTYVQPYYRSKPNKNKFDNFSTKGNVNPYNGKKGNQNPTKNSVPKKKKSK